MQHTTTAEGQEQIKVAFKLLLMYKMLKFVKLKEF